MTARWIAARVIQEIVRDRRTLVFFMVVPVVVMTLVYYAVRNEEVGRVAVVTRGAARLFDADMLSALRDEDDVDLVNVTLPDDVATREKLTPYFERALKAGEVDAVLFFDEKLLAERVEGERGQVHLFVDGSRPNKTAAALSGVQDAMDELADALPTIVDASCTAECANSVNASALDLEEHFLYGDSEMAAVDYFLPVLPPFFVFFFTFILATVAFQRERLRGTLERILVAPVSFAQVVLGYTGGFVIFAGVQSTVVVAYFLQLTAFEVGPGQLGTLAVVITLMLLISLLLGLLASFVSHNEFQAIQFIPLVILPQIFLSDIIWDIDRFPTLFRWISYALPLTHANAAVRDVLVKGHTLPQVLEPIGILASFLVGVTALLALVGRRAAG